MADTPLSVKYSLIVEKCLHPKKPRYADNGDGWTDFKLNVFELSMRVLFTMCVRTPKNKYNRFLIIAYFFITVSVNFSQPFFCVILAFVASTLSTLFKSNTPSFAHGLRSPHSPKANTKIIIDFFKYIFKDGGAFNSLIHRKTQPMSLLILRGKGLGLK